MRRTHCRPNSTPRSASSPAGCPSSTQPGQTVSCTPPTHGIETSGLAAQIRVLSPRQGGQIHGWQIYGRYGPGQFGFALSTAETYTRRHAPEMPIVTEAAFVSPQADAASEPESSTSREREISREKNNTRPRQPAMHRDSNGLRISLSKREPSPLSSSYIYPAHLQLIRCRPKLELRNAP